MKKASYIAAAVILIAVVVLAAYFMRPQKRILKVSTTTSLYATGLLDYLASKFEENHPNVAIEFIPVGSGEALRRAAQGDVDMVFVHAPSLEKKYVDEGVLEGWKIIAYNYFVIVGPPDDPAGIKGMSPVDAFKRIAEAGAQGKALFISRGDNSGTNVKEISLWKAAGIKPGGKWYIESGTGMSETLLIASEKGAYTLSDIGTFLKLKAEGKIRLVILVAGGDELLNIYSVYVVNPKVNGGANYNLAQQFRDFVASPEGQRLIGEYGVDKYGQPLFYPAAGKEEWLHEMWIKLSSG